ncbi:hypothetical protein EVAR_48646_1 [Eumeta japonica]|uniref:Uncharacterized protein n=1 Tax=Eumeta variegata TaxID=151549 RepID=A0A4C1XSK6_EUMVA|nr:hypothetical protein EVAR_48646_1 [Eumeta japonica]
MAEGINTSTFLEDDKKFPRAGFLELLPTHKYKPGPKAFTIQSQARKNTWELAALNLREDSYGLLPLNNVRSQSEEVEQRHATVAASCRKQNSEELSWLNVERYIARTLFYTRSVLGDATIGSRHEKRYERHELDDFKVRRCTTENPIRAENLLAYREEITKLGYVTAHRIDLSSLTLVLGQREGLTAKRLNLKYNIGGGYGSTVRRIKPDTTSTHSGDSFLKF